MCRGYFHTGDSLQAYQAVEKLLRGRSAVLPLAQKLNVLQVRLAFSLACALHPGLLVTFFNSLPLRQRPAVRGPFFCFIRDFGGCRRDSTGILFPTLPGKPAPCICGSPIST
jgi:hypothetical protein